MPNRTIVEYLGGHDGHRCGYCKGTNTNYSQGMWAHTMTVQDYQDLLDRGWRRSGQYCYKPTMNIMCCPHYTIRCDVGNFKLSRSQKKTLKLVNRYLNEDIKPKHEMDSTVDKNISQNANVAHDVFVTVPKEPQQKLSHFTGEEFEDLVAKPSTSSEKRNIDTMSEVKEQNEKNREDKLQSNSIENKKGVSFKPGKGADPSLPKCKKQKLLRREKYIQKHGELRPKVNQEKTLQDFLQETVENPAHKLELQLVRSSPADDLFDDRFETSYAVYKTYQMTIHGDPPDKPSQKQYKRFLVNSPLQPADGTHPDFPGYGSFHQHYLLDGKIIAVGVIDILPGCVSSKYFYYDPEYDFLSLGTYSALREIAFVQELQKMEENLKYYYMGFYIHSCPKMRYKGQYHSSYLLCPESYTWVPIEDCIKKVDETAYSRFSYPGIEDSNKIAELDNVLILHSRTLMPYMIYKSFSEGYDENEIKEYAELVGKTCAQRIALYRS